VTYDQRTPMVTVGSDSTRHSLSQLVTGLLSHVIYHVRLVATNSAGTVTSSDEVLTTGNAPAPGPPTLAKTANLIPISGLVFVKLPASGHRTRSARADGQLDKAQGFIPLTQARQVPLGSEIDARHGTLQLVAATPTERHTQQARLNGAIFSVGQTRAGRDKGLATLTLQENAFPGAPSYTSCSTARKPHGKHEHAPGADREAHPQSPPDPQRQRQPRQLPHQGTLQRRHRARHPMGDPGPLRRNAHKVNRGRVNVQDFHTRKTITLHAGQSFLAKAAR
jgi:hypothetical protein